MNEAIILAGGFGTRLQGVVNDVPKPMAPVNGEPFLNYELYFLKYFGIQRVILSVGYLHEKITNYYNNNFKGLELDYSIESEPLGTGGGIRLALEKCRTNSVLVLNGDSFFDFDLNSFIGEHVSSKVDCSLALRKIENAARYGTVQLNKNDLLSESGLKEKSGSLSGRISFFKEKSGEEKPGLINAGTYILNKNTFLSKTEPNQNFSIEKDFFEKYILELKIFGFEHEGYFIDIGIPEDFAKAQNDFKGFKYK